MLVRRAEKDGGFTLIELMVVVLIIAVLVAIAIPTFLGARRRAQDTTAKSHLRSGLVAEKTYYSDQASYTNDIAALEDVEGNLAWGNYDAAARGVIVEHVSANFQGLVLRSLSRSGTLFCLADTTQPFDYTPERYSITQAGTWYTKRDDALDTSDCKDLVWEPSSAGWT